ncbi:MFS transporter [Streptomyces sp. SL13]|uniref:MFS transporter n=1 Tax=Streptantibioticus silvisoli TaxID=2705255 RepID=A0AA90HB96_9ACTN|nr:MFS transporter [Streptantibioticus silvisoli]MDI5972440.1 MFS transporter [Streptantibioticus silvisoli]
MTSGNPRRRTALRRLAGSLGWWETLTTPGPPRLLAVNALAGACGSGLATVCLPLFAVRVAGVDAARLVTVLSLTAGCELLAAVPNGALAGRFGVRRFIVTAKTAQAVLWIAMAFAHGFWGLLALSAATGVARAGGGGLSQSVTAAVLPSGARSEVLGSVRALRNVGYLVSGALGSAMLTFDSPWVLRASLVVNGLSYVCGTVCMALVDARGARRSPGRTDFSVLRDAPYFGLILCASVFGTSLIVLDVGLSLWVLRHPQVPRALVGVVLVVNTLVVVVLQHRYSRKSAELDGARRSIRGSVVAFVAMAVLIGGTAEVSTPWAVVLVVAAAVALTFGELYESPAWWTISFELSPPDRRDEYLSAFDLSGATVGILGPLALAAVVALGTLGWLLYAALFVVAGAAALALITRRTRSPAGPVDTPDPKALADHA